MIDLSDPHVVYVAISYAVTCFAILGVWANLFLKSMRLKRQLERLGLADIGRDT
jgi:Heme exporter protein D (CcmD)